jgi:hypothetical protein
MQRKSIFQVISKDGDPFEPAVHYEGYPQETFGEFGDCRAR